jgi:5,5'-dehydrodivanillate O-demethylase
VHTSFVYRKTEPHWREVPEVSAETSEHGLVLTTVRSGEKRITRYYFPNLMRVTVFLIPGEDLEFPHFLWHVPIDDENSMFISATAVPAHLRDRIPQAQAGRVMAEGAAADLLSARRPPASITEEDYVAMVGQAVVADRTNERLGRSDVGVVWCPGSAPDP